MYNNRVLIGNWYEEQNGSFASQNEGNKESSYQKDYKERVMPVRDDKVFWKIRNKSLGLPTELFWEHGVHNTYNKNFSSLYDINCMLTYNEPMIRQYKIRERSWLPTQNFTQNYGPGRCELIKKKQDSWIKFNDKIKLSTEYQSSYTIK